MQNIPDRLDTSINIKKFKVGLHLYCSSIAWDSLEYSSHSPALQKSVHNAPPTAQARQIGDRF